MSDRDKFKVRVGSDNVGLAILILGLLILTWGEPDLLDVLAHWCKQQMGAL